MARFQCYRTERFRVRWRLLGGNNRVLGACVGESADHMAALAEINRLRVNLRMAAFEVQHVPGGLWLWRMRLPELDIDRLSGNGIGLDAGADSGSEVIDGNGGKPADGDGTVEVAWSGRGFARRVDANLAYARFRRHAESAEVDLTLAVFQPGRRGREIALKSEFSASVAGELAAMPSQRPV